MHVISLTIFVAEGSDCNSFFREDFAVHFLILPMSVIIYVRTGISSCDKCLRISTFQEHAFKPITLLLIRFVSKLVSKLWPVSLTFSCFSESVMCLFTIVGGCLFGVNLCIYLILSQSFASDFNLTVSLASCFFLSFSISY